MSAYASYTVAQLKDALKEKNLSTEGKKADLLARLTEAETTTEQAEELPQNGAGETEELPEPAATETEPTVETTEAAPASAEAEAEPIEEKKPEKKILTPEERKALAVDLLTKKIKRAEKFGDEASATAAKKDLARVEKFGVDPSTALGKEIGALDKDVNTELATRKQRRNSNKGRGKGKGNGQGKGNKVHKK